MRLMKDTHIDFVGMRKISYAITVIILLVLLGALIIRGLNWSIDFTSGVAAKIDLKAANATVAPVEIDELRASLKNNGFPEAEIQHVGPVEDATFLIKIKSAESKDEVSGDTKTAIVEIIKGNFPKHVEGRDMNREVIEEIYEVGPKVGGELRTNALIAVLISLVLMIVYIWFRFELIFGVMAMVALAHDAFIIIGVFALTGKEITVQIIAALLTIVGYSINDTIVIFDRVREDLKLRRKEPIEQIFNAAINQTLSRTVLTFGTTLITSLALYLFGGTVLHDFALAMIIGLIAGTYSTIFIAGNLVVDFTRATHKEKQAMQHLTKRK